MPAAFVEIAIVLVAIRVHNFSHAMHEVGLPVTTEAVSTSSGAHAAAVTETVLESALSLVAAGVIHAANASDNAIFDLSTIHLV